MSKKQDKSGASNHGNFGSVSGGFSKLWHDAACADIAREIDKLCCQIDPPKFENPDSPLRVELLKLASICKGAGYTQRDAWNLVAFAVRKHPQTPRKIKYQISRAWKIAEPRHPQTPVSNTGVTATPKIDSFSEVRPPKTPQIVVKQLSANKQGANDDN